MTSWARAALIVAASLGGFVAASMPLVGGAGASSAFAEPSAGRKLDIKRLRPDAGTRGVAIDKITRTPPDPEPLFEKGQWVFDLRWSKGDVYLLGIHRLELAAPQHTPRAMGRFALELYEGPALIERVRFDFPLLGVGDTIDAGTRPSFERRLTSRIGVMFPATTRGTRLELWDRATDTRWPIPWPPQEPSADR